MNGVHQRAGGKRENIGIQDLGIETTFGSCRESDLGVHATKDNLPGVITDCLVEIGGIVFIQDTSKLYQETKYLVKKREGMETCIPTGRTELAELSKLIYMCNVAGIRMYNMEIIDHALKKEGSLKAAKRKLGTGKN